MTAQERLHTASTDRRPTSRGFTLAEALIASVFLAIAVVGVASTLAAASAAASNLSQSANCQSLARELLEEVSSKSFTTQPNHGFTANATDRSTYDDIGDYDTYTDNTTNGMKTLQGTTVNLNDAKAYTRTVAVDYRATPSGSKAASGDFAMVTVTVTSSGGVSVALQRLLTNPVVRR
jgi:Tfp pilus assembly protein PilV